MSADTPAPRADARRQAGLNGDFAVLDQWVSNVTSGGFCDVYVGRRTRTHDASEWGNPHRLVSNSEKARLSSVAGYGADLLAGRLGDPSALAALTGRLLGCWCSPKLCHAHVLAAAANCRPGTVAAFTDTLAAAAALEPYRLLVTGSRAWTDERAVADVLLSVWDGWGRPNDAVMVVGDAPGADAIAARAWRRAGLIVEVHRADWDRHGKRAGMIRNAEMVSSGVDRCVAFSVNDSKGTAHCASAARRAGVPVDVIRRDTNVER